jgi:hypothetical protein
MTRRPMSLVTHEPTSIPIKRLVEERGWSTTSATSATVPGGVENR